VVDKIVVFTLIIERRICVDVSVISPDENKEFFRTTDRLSKEVVVGSGVPIGAVEYNMATV